MIAELLVLYSGRPVAVISEISQLSPERASSGKIQSFLDPLCLKKD